MAKPAPPGISVLLAVNSSDWLDGGFMYWIICESIKNENAENCCHRWIAFPATEESLKDVIEIAKLGGGRIFVTKEFSV